MYDKTVRRRRAVLALLVVSSLILLTAYFGESAAGGLHSVQRGVMSVVSPIEEGASRALKPVRDLFGWVGDTLDAKGELQKAEKDRDAWQKRAIGSEDAMRQNRHLRQLLDLDTTLGLDQYQPVTSRVIGKSPTVWYQTLDIDKGTSAGVHAGMPVIATDGSGDGTGLIGRVDFVARNAAKVRLITDSKVAVSARVLKNDVFGVVAPKVGDPEDLVLKYTTRDDFVKPKDVIVTTGTTSARGDIQSPFPPGIPIGQVTRVDEEGTDAQEVHLKPFVNLRRVEFVQVLTKRVNGNRE